MHTFNANFIDKRIWNNLYPAPNPALLLSYVLPTSALYVTLMPSLNTRSASPTLTVALEPEVQSEALGTQLSLDRLLLCAENIRGFYISVFVSFGVCVCLMDWSTTDSKIFLRPSPSNCPYHHSCQPEPEAYPYHLLEVRKVYQIQRCAQHPRPSEE